jgi:Tat protein translocase TatB subunit
MFGVGPSELVIIGLLFLVIFGPSKLPQMARDAGRLMTEARRAMDDFKEELTSAGDEDKEDQKKPAKKASREKAASTASKSEHDAPKENGRVAEDEEEYDL